GAAGCVGSKATEDFELAGVVAGDVEVPVGTCPSEEDLVVPGRRRKTLKRCLVEERQLSVERTEQFVEGGNRIERGVGICSKQMDIGSRRAAGGERCERQSGRSLLAERGLRAESTSVGRGPKAHRSVRLDLCKIETPVRISERG